MYYVTARVLIVAYAAISCPKPRLCSTISVCQNVHCHICVSDCLLRQAVQCHIYVRLCSAISVCQTVHCHICVSDCAQPYLCVRLCTAISVCQTVQCHICM